MRTQDRAVELVRRKLVALGMKPFFLGQKGTRRVEFISYPWQAGSELFILIREPNKPTTVECVEAQQVEPTGQSNSLPA